LQSNHEKDEMPADARITYRKKNPYHTRSNYFRKVRTPGGRIVIHYLKKLHLKPRSIPKCSDTGKPLRGLLPNRGNYKNRRMTRIQMSRKAVSRAYGGNLSHSALRLRIMRAFLTEESRIVRKVQKTRREKRLQGKSKPKKKKVVTKRKPTAKAAKKQAPEEEQPTEPRKPSKHEEKVARREVRREKRKVKQEKKKVLEEQAGKAPKKEAEDDGGKKKERWKRKERENNRSQATRRG